ncbi:hypothetical protein AB9P05_01635 [Roseivirga sp. BDSF3-8]|uniref:hypothetical protein n=1 Tax=Roseivirga sp. BDSF3-8 TaxID=3241598 RepID=UPI00353219BE
MRFAIFLLLLLPVSLYAQNDDIYGLKNPNEEGNEACTAFKLARKALPPDLSYGIHIEDRKIILAIRSKEAFEKLFDHKYDGIAVDVIERRQYPCDRENGRASAWAYNGYLMPPVYLKELEENAVVLNNNWYLLTYGELPSRYEVADIELNLLMVQKKYLCEYIQPINVESSQWSLLEMGMYRDSLPTENKEGGHQLISKVLRFTVPFNQNQVSFEKEEIQPLYDSLDLTDYNIKEINVKAYASVEGSLEKNLELQRGRANSIISALQAYQKPEISSTIITNENWVEFLNEIQGTEYSYLAGKSKEEVKEELQKPGVLNDLEPALSTHRKALIELKLQKKFSEAENDPVMLKKFFDQSIKEKNVEEALYIQNIVYELIKDEKLPGEFLDKLEVPKTTQYGSLLNNQWVFRYELNGEDVYEHIKAFERLNELMPDNRKVLYNLTALKLKAWTQGELITNKREIEGLLDKLQRLDLHESLLIRLITNYKIILVSQYDAGMNYSKKRATLKDISMAYYDLELSDADLVSLAKFLSRNAAYDWARNILEERAYDVGASEDLIFFYLNLTIGNPAMRENIAYRTLLLNAIEKNTLRFCEMFRSRHVGGVSFQLLDNDYLKTTYCESCSFEPSK